jgi:hypothetical protein
LSHQTTFYAKSHFTITILKVSAFQVGNIREWYDFYFKRGNEKKKMLDFVTHARYTRANSYRGKEKQLLNLPGTLSACSSEKVLFSIHKTGNTVSFKYRDFGVYLKEDSESAEIVRICRASIVEFADAQYRTFKSPCFLL